MCSMIIYIPDLFIASKFYTHCMDVQIVFTSQTTSDVSSDIA